MIETTSGNPAVQHLAVIADNQSDLVTFSAESRELTATHADEITAMLDGLISHLEVLQPREEDRTWLKNIRADVNKASKEYLAGLRGVKSTATRKLDTTIKDVDTKVKEIAALVAERIHVLDEADRNAKIALLSETFADEVDLSDESSPLRAVTFDDVASTSWFNRSASTTKSVADLHTRLQAIESLTSFAQGTVSVQDILAQLKALNWNTTAVMSAIQEMIRTQEEEERRAQEEEERRAQELEDARKQAADEARQQALEEGRKQGREEGRRMGLEYALNHHTTAQAPAAQEPEETRPHLTVTWEGDSPMGLDQVKPMVKAFFESLGFTSVEVTM